MSDLIRREDAIKAVNDTKYCSGTVKAIFRYEIEKVPIYGNLDRIRSEIEKEIDFIISDHMTEQELHYVEGMKRALVILDRKGCETVE